MEKWNISNWADSRELVLTLRRPRGVVSITSPLGGDWVESASIPNGTAESALATIDRLVGRWIPPSADAPKARYRFTHHRGDYRVLQLDLEGESNKGGPLRLGVWLTEAPRLSSRLAQALKTFLHR